MIRSLLSGILICATLLATAPKASAEILFFSYSDSISSFTFELDRTPTSITTVGDQFYISGVANSSSASIFDVYFYGSSLGGGISFAQNDQVLSLNNGYLSFSSDQLFAGTASAPSFVGGKFKLTGFDPGSVEAATLVISAAVPEPSTWGLMLIGFAGIAFISVRRRSAYKALLSDAST